MPKSAKRRASQPTGAETLVVVESPAKARSIQKMLGPGYEVRASLGHVVDLPERSLGVDVERDFAPTYEVKKDKKPVVEELKRAAEGKRLLIATDPDREGEAIGWHVARLLGRDDYRDRIAGALFDGIAAYSRSVAQAEPGSGSDKGVR